MKTIIITGASGGIGTAIAERFLASDWKVIGTSTSGTVGIQHEHFIAHKLDLSDEKSTADFVETIGDAKVDALINNAGINTTPDGEKIDIQPFRKTLEVNLVGLIELTESLLDKMIDGGSILNISSTAGLISSPMNVQMTAYRISKAGVNMYTHTLAQRLQPRRIIVSAYNPGWVRTKLNNYQGPKEPAQVAEEVYRLVTENKESGYFWDETNKITNV